MRTIKTILAVIIVLFPITNSYGQEGGPSLEDLARAAQDPLASISAFVSDNTINFGTGDDEDTAYLFQLQGVYSINTSWGVNLIPRVILPIIGAPKGSQLPILDPSGGGSGTTWGLGDSMAQLFITPTGSGNWKWGIGPQVSFATHTKADLKGPDWGAGAGGLVIGSLGNFSVGGLVSNHWSFDGDFNTLSFQPLMYYNFVSAPGVSLSYNPNIIADWKLDTSDRWTVPLGLGIGKTFVLGSKGHAVDVSVGGYGVPIRPDGGPKAQLKLALFFMFPR
jgi:hypothetical protein